MAMGLLSGHGADATTALLKKYCLDCHDSGQRKGDLSLEDVDVSNPAANSKFWEKVVEKLHHRQMPPLGEPRPEDAAYDRAVAQLTSDTV